MHVDSSRSPNPTGAARVRSPAVDTTPQNPVAQDTDTFGDPRDSETTLTGASHRPAHITRSLALQTQSDAHVEEAPNVDLQKGDSSDAVAALQHALVKLGFLDEAKLANGGEGIFGPATEEAVMEFQAKNGIERLGLYGPATRAALEIALGGGGSTAPAGSGTASTYAPAVELGVGHTGAEVVSLQRALVKLGLLDEAKLANGGEGIFGPATETAVQALQAKHGVETTGFYGPQTRAVLEKVLGGGGTQAGTAGTGATASVDLEEGAEGPAVERLQKNLVRLGYMTQTQVDSGTGSFGPQTRTAVKAFQRDQGVESTGFFGPLTRGAMADAFKDLAANHRVPQTDLAPGDESASVEKLQNNLVELGYLTAAQVNSGKGTFGPQTKTALTEFQKSVGLGAVGVFGAQTRQKLVEALATAARGSAAGGVSSQEAEAARARNASRAGLSANANDVLDRANAHGLYLTGGLGYWNHYHSAGTSVDVSNYAGGGFTETRAMRAFADRMVEMGRSGARGPDGQPLVAYVVYAGQRAGINTNWQWVPVSAWARGDITQGHWDHVHVSTNNNY
jgi:peptidoglycan hydrolase-like protein with peptidoglycan-binding domain